MYIKKSRLIAGALTIIMITATISVAIVNPFGSGHIMDFLKFSIVSKTIGSVYYEDIDGKEAANMAIAGVAAATGDPYTGFLWGDTARQYMEEVEGDYCGVGLYIEYDMEQNLVSVVSAIAGSPAEAEGIGTGDKIIRVDGEVYLGEELTEAANRMRGEEGTEVTLTIRSAKTGEERDVTLTRRHIEIPAVTGEMVDAKVGRISISQFTANVSERFKEKYDELKGQGMTSLIIDLRNNPGGLLDEAVNIASMFIDRGKLITYTLDKSGNKEEYFSASEADVTPDLNMPVVILINQGSASASEVLSGAMKSYDRAVLLGEKSYGKGIVQGVFEIGEDILSVTVSRYYTPDGVCIHGEGIGPDLEVIMDDEKSAYLSSLKKEEDNQLLAAIEFLNME